MKESMVTTSVKFVVVGDCDVGKTSMVQAYTKSGRTAAGPLQITTAYTMVQDKMVMIATYDTKGDAHLDNLRRMSYPQCDMFVIVFSLNDRKSLENVFTRWIPEIAPYDRPWILVGAKMDLRVMSKDYIHQRLSSSSAMAYLETCAMIPETIDLLFQHATDTVLALRKRDKKTNCCTIL